MRTKIPKFHCLWGAILAFFLGAGHAEAPNMDGLIITEQQAIGLFYQRNLDLIAAKYNLDQAQAERIIAAAIPNPVFGLMVSELNAKMLQDKYSGKLPALSPQIQQLIETAGKRRLRIESSELGSQAVEFDLQDTARLLTNAVRRAFYGLLLAQKTTEVARDNLDRYREILRANEIRLKAGDIAETDYVRIEVESLKAQGELDNTQTALAQARADLLVLLGWPENSLEITAAESWPILSSESTRLGQDALVYTALEQRPDLKAARVRIQQAEKNLTLARRLAIPDVTVTGYFARDPGNFFMDTGGIGISLPLPLFYRQEGEIARAGVNMNSAELFVRQTEQGVRAEVMKALAAWKSADAIARRFEESVVARIDKLRKAQEYAYRKGAVGLLELIDAERNYKAMMLDYYAALASRSNAYADLLMALAEEASS
ncbi:MAG TPA: TolC family protein [Methylococcaceae bacterium]|jgi:cobalt-zinc-cadmium efflux system outer membrane protein|nr:TolC family protein [Methylococcaceae bacterium]